MSERRAKGCLFAALLWCVILGILAVGYRFLVHPYLRDQLQGVTGSSSQYEDQLVVSADSFSGYAILRSEQLRSELRDQKIKLAVLDDQADYGARLKALQRGETQLAVFTIDSLITAGAALGDFPGSIVLILDETAGSDAVVAKRSAVGSVQDLNDAEAKWVLTPRSPSEFLARVVIAHFNLPELPADWIEEADGAQEVLRQLKTASPGQKRAYVLWEPYVSLALQEPDVHVLLDSSKLQGYVVDVLVAQREFLRDHPEKVRGFVEAYLRTTYAYARRTNGLFELVQQDATLVGSPSLSAAQTGKIVEGIRWKNTLENYAHFGLAPSGSGGGMAHIEDMIANIMDVLVRTDAIDSDPLNGQYHTLFFRQVLADMKGDGFHPGKGLNVVPDLGPGLENLESVRVADQAQALSDAQWDSLQSVGEMKVAAIDFVRGSARLSISSQRELTALAKRLQTFPNYYLRIVGHTRSQGDPEANRRLAESRAAAAADWLHQNGVPAERIRTEASPASAGTGVGQSVSFELGQVPY